ncbi:MAG: hypothetical protein ACK55I_09700, partial [bacterium]
MRAAKARRSLDQAGLLRQLPGRRPEHQIAATAGRRIMTSHVAVVMIATERPHAGAGRLDLAPGRVDAHGLVAHVAVHERAVLPRVGIHVHLLQRVGREDLAQ